ncbi:hypothetical protein CesoFtcFv8_004487 [Champsocephalus esox]|uniref:Uncharacterized protein n=1 Tax=Champsocephalus esox TaxID=159716 RepID=A0AAN8CMG4_9TELE|nr:hypothetical protein CesoFtcFv8_004487 [Champsocephalus esox]
MRDQLEKAQHNMDAKLDQIGSRMEEHLRGVRDQMGQLREYMDRHGEYMKQGLDSFREETNRNFETAEAEMQAQKNDMEILEERTAGIARSGVPTSRTLLRPLLNNKPSSKISCLFF